MSKTEQMLNLDVFFSDLAKYAEITEVSFDAQAMRTILDLFDDIYPEATISIRTTTHPVGQRDVNFRYMAPYQPHNPFERLKDAGLLVPQGKPVEKVIAETLDRYDVWWGIDVAVSHGLEKIWMFLKTGVAIDELLSMSSLPDAARNCRDHLMKFTPDGKIVILGLDFWNNTMNIYPTINPPHAYSPGKIAAMIDDLGFELPSEDELQRVSGMVNFYYTFSWENPDVQRLCYVIPTPAEGMPADWHPLVTKFVENVPFQADQQMFAFNTTYGPRAGYFKIEADYRGTLGSKVFTYWNK